MVKRLFVEVQSLKQIANCEETLGDNYIIIYVFDVNEHEDMLNFCLAHHFPICPIRHIYSDKHIYERIKHNIYFNICKDYIPHILINHTIFSTPYLNDITILKHHSFNSILWEGEVDQIPQLQQMSNISIIRIIDSVSNDINLYNINSYWLKYEHIDIFR